jgi:hypothetical protein
MENSSILSAIALNSPQQDQLFTALSKAQGSFEIARKDGSNPHFKSKFASYTELVLATRPALCANGLSVNHKTITDYDGKQFMLTKLMHASGQFDACLVPLRPDKKMDVQGYGSERSYQMRYSYKEILGVAANDGEDDDGEAAVGRNNEQKSNISYVYIDSNVVTPAQIKTIDLALSSFENGEWLRARILEHNKVVSLNELSRTEYDNALKFIMANGKS